MLYGIERVVLDMQILRDKVVRTAFQVAILATLMGFCKHFSAFLVDNFLQPKA